MGRTTEGESRTAVGEQRVSRVEAATSIAGHADSFDHSPARQSNRIAWDKPKIQTEDQKTAAAEVAVSKLQSRARTLGDSLMDVLGSC
jgi:hypothetical protein